MIRTFADLRVGDAGRHEALSVFPLFAEPGPGVAYELSHEAMGKGAVLVAEVSTGGSVPTLSVENKGDVRVLFLEGEQLVGAKQNRILNTSLLVAAHAKSTIPVSCVEAGRWASRSPYFEPGFGHSPSSLRRVVKSSVYRSLRASHGYVADQGAVWNEVARKQDALASPSETGAMHDIYEAHRTRLAEFREKLPYAQGAVGAAVAIGGKVVAIDVFDKAETCGRVWGRMLDGPILDALEVREQAGRVEAMDVERALAGVGALTWERSPSPGEGEDFRAVSSTGDHASALVLEGTLVHGSVVYAR